MKVLLIEGPPGSGKTTYSGVITDYLGKQRIPHVYVDERLQDTAVFGDYWELEAPDWQVVAENLQLSWKRYTELHIQQDAVYVFDNSLLNQVQYLLILNAGYDVISTYFETVCGLFSEIGAGMVFLDGESEIMVSRVDQLRTNGWGDRVAKLLQRYPYQRQRNRTGRAGMIDFFRDSQILKRQLVSRWPYRLAHFDVTEQGNFDEKQEIIAFVSGICSDQRT